TSFVKWGGPPGPPTQGGTMRQLILALVITAAASHAATLALNPLDGAVSGLPGQSTGWGYQFTAGPGEFDVLTFSLLLVPDGIGDYVDYLLLPQTFEGIPPGLTNQHGSSFDSTTGSGTGEFDIFPAAPPGTIPGTLLVFYDTYPADPSTGVSPSSSGNFLEQDVSITVLAPEPSFAALLALLLAAGVYLHRFRRITRI